ncbi:MAG: YceI family protein [Actinomycetia bacterium]|nr:YceI family protein [Actinomycetes bacterium]
MAQFTAGTWTIDQSHSEIGFSVRHLMSKVRGKFEEFEGEIVTDESGLGSVASATIQLSSVNTGTEDRDNHLRSSDFFSIEETPAMTFRSTGVRDKGETYVALGDLTIRGVTKPVELEVEVLGEGGDPWGGRRIGLEAKTEISRKEFGIDFNIPVPGEKAMIGDKVTIALSVEAVLQS